MNKNIINVGIANKEKDLFESQYPIPNGMAYNSYLILDEKVALFDTVEENGTDKWLENIDNALNGRNIDYLIISHMEPDHSANIQVIIDKFPNIILVASQRAFAFLYQFYKIKSSDNFITVKDGSTLSLGKHNFQFFTAPMVHWPEVIVSYESTEKILFSADAFGKFGEEKTTDNWIDEARRYYFNIVGKYGVQVQALFKKLSGLEIKTIYSLHGPALNKDITKYFDIYNTWSKYEAENVNGIYIAYTSVYGNTKKVALEIYDKLKSKGFDVTITDLSRTEVSTAVSEAFRNSKLILASTTYDGGLFPVMAEFVEHLVTKNYQNRKIAFVENGTWAPQAGRKMREKLESLKNITICENVVTLRSAKNDDNNIQIDNLIDELVK